MAFLCYDIARFLRRPRRAIPWIIARGNRGNYVVRLTVLRGIAGISYFDWEDLAGFLTLGGDFKLLGLSLPGLITFLIFGLLTLASVLAVVKY